MSGQSSSGNQGENSRNGIFFVLKRTLPEYYFLLQKNFFHDMEQQFICYTQQVSPQQCVNGLPPIINQAVSKYFSPSK